MTEKRDMLVGMMGRGNGDFYDRIIQCTKKALDYFVGGVKMAKTPDNRTEGRWGVNW